MVKTTYVSNTIRIPTHVVDFSHQGLGFGGGDSKSPMEPPQSEERRIKEERKRGEKKRKKGATQFCAGVMPAWLA
jgi:hypothetical protein